MGLFSGVSSDVASLVFKTVESLIAEGALVGTGQVLLSSIVLDLLRGVLQQRSHEAHGSSSHGRSRGRCGGGRRLLLGERSVGVEQVSKTCRGGGRLHVTESESLGKGDDGGLGYMYGSQFGGRVGVD